VYRKRERERERERERPIICCAKQRLFLIKFPKCSCVKPKHVAEFWKRGYGRSVIGVSNAYMTSNLFFLWRFDSIPRHSFPLRGFAITHTHTHTVGMTLLGQWSAWRTDLYLTSNITHNRQISMPPDGIRTQNPSKRAAADPHLRPRGHWGRHIESSFK